MKKFTSLLIGCSLMLAGAVMAQQPDEQSSEKNKKQQAQEKAHEARGKPGPNANVAKPEKGNAAMKRRGAVNESAAAKVQKPEATGAKEHGTMNQHTEHAGGARTQNANAARKTEKAAEAETNVSGQAAVGAAPVVKQHRKRMKAPGANAKVAATPAPTAAASAAPPVSTASQQNNQANVAAAGGAKKKPDPQKVQQIKQQHANFRAQPKPQQVPAVTFQQNYRIQGADRWQGRQYEVFRSYHPERHDRNWYHSRYNRVELIGGGYYYWNDGYWYPAWGYNPSNEYYAYDAPIYVGHRAEPPDRVIADVQAELQEMGYYKGEVDGLLGPLTREALTSYQADQGLTPTAVIDEPTLDSLGMG
jgi:putative peptidoglycan binding protein